MGLAADSLSYFETPPNRAQYANWEGLVDAGVSQHLMNKKTEEYGVSLRKA